MKWKIYSGSCFQRLQAGWAQLRCLQACGEAQQPETKGEDKKGGFLHPLYGYAPGDLTSSPYLYTLPKCVPSIAIQPFGGIYRTAAKGAVVGHTCAPPALYREMHGKQQNPPIMIWGAQGRFAGP